MAFGEIFLAAFLRVLISVSGVVEICTTRGTSIELDKWSKTLSRIRKVLDDAEEKQHTEGALKEWLDDLRDLAYDMEDILDEFATKVLRRKLMGKSPTSTLKVKKLASAYFTCLTPSVVKINIRLRSNITKITARFNDLMSQKDQLKLNESVDVRSNKRKETQPSNFCGD
ncbi:putative disease resistance RPP13-like protein 1 [Juglans microcarpa x Juglans regia]|uniref:putative disease resistance RPP13-like protein 1 n=1 Tax=Juglans microcarpa x Juglans regia TaxID=2249226 RepID=UPI001B7E1C3C|nr:putative disease resistance RPP13-like protein 1 [Juglans microcarpa x Juglans regia]